MKRRGEAMTSVIKAQSLFAESWTQTPNCRNKNVPSKVCPSTFHFTWALEMKFSYSGTSWKLQLNYLSFAASCVTVDLRACLCFHVSFAYMNCKLFGEGSVSLWYSACWCITVGVLQADITAFSE